MARRRRTATGRQGFTLIEVLAAALLMAVVLPVVMNGVSISTRAAGIARHRDEASGLARAKLSELVVTGQWQSGTLSGDFSPDWPDYRWEASIQAQTNSTLGTSTQVTLQQLDLRVIWSSRNVEDSLTLSTLVYQRSSQ
jgi:prepilin-type N-terminal cleavage/methylation domain-containing protein